MSTRYTFRQVIRSLFKDYQLELTEIIRQSTRKNRELINEIRSLKDALLLLRDNSMEIESGWESNNKAFINKLGSLKVIAQTVPDLRDPVLSIAQTGFLVDENGSSNGLVAGSLANPIDFEVKALENEDLFISSLSFKIVDQNAILSKFGNINALTNGMQLIYKSIELGEIVLADNLQTNFDFIRLCTGTPPVSSGPEAFRAANVGGPGGNSEAYIPVLNISQVFGKPFGVRLKAGTFDSLAIRIRDDITTIDEFDVFYYGSKIFKE